MKIIETAMKTPEIERLQNALTELTAVIVKIVTERVDEALAQLLPITNPSNNSDKMLIENGETTRSPATPLLYDIKRAAARLSMSAPSVRKLIRQGRIRPVADFRKVLIPESELQRFAGP
ncbi:MAG TPA: helix-turn-helix domain-containing protein [Verrucomicrobiae bacterium]|nr:helix-turn-helix domain-containing protein [Verrucomicrobiae bacterium]